MTTHLEGTARHRAIQAILFDLDGTLADTAPDLANAANLMRIQRDLEPLPLSTLRPFASHGARGLVHTALGVGSESPEYEALRIEFLANYAARICVESALFPGVPSLLDALDERDIPWGIVTNKATRFTSPVVMGLALHERAAIVVSGDTTPFSKPHPEPLLHALRNLNVRADTVIYVGDDIRDIQAGAAAGMKTAAVTFGYGAQLDPHQWGADYVIDAPADLLKLLDQGPILR